MVAAEESLDAGKSLVERLKCVLATEVKRVQQFMAERRGTSQTASRSLAKSENSFRDLLLKVATMTAERDEWYDQTAKGLEKLKVAEADIALNSALREAVREFIITHTVEIAKLQEHLTAKSAELSRLSAKHRKLTNKLSRVKLQNTAGATILDNLKLVAGIVNVQTSVRG